MAVGLVAERRIPRSLRQHRISHPVVTIPPLNCFPRGVQEERTLFRSRRRRTLGWSDETQRAGDDGKRDRAVQDGARRYHQHRLVQIRSQLVGAMLLALAIDPASPGERRACFDTKVPG